MKTHKLGERVPIPPVFQIVLMIISAVIIFYFLYARLIFFTSRDIKPYIETITPEVKSEFGGYQDLVQVDLFIDKFEKADFLKNEFIFTGTIAFEFNPEVITVAQIERFGFDSGEILFKSPPELMLLDNNILARYNIRVRFSSPLNYADFPLDDHTLYLVLTNQFFTPSEVEFVSNRASLNVYGEITGWEKVDRAVETGYNTVVLDKFDKRKTANFPIVIFSIDLSRNGMRYVLTILLPLLLIFYLVLFSFSVEPGTSISLTAGGITGILAYRFVIENLSPTSGSFMMSDYLFFLFLAGSFFVFFLNLIDITAIKISILIKEIILLGLYILMTAASIYLFWTKK